MKNYSELTKEELLKEISILNKQLLVMAEHNNKLRETSLETSLENDVYYELVTLLEDQLHKTKFSSYCAGYDEWDQRDELCKRHIYELFEYIEGLEEELSFLRDDYLKKENEKLKKNIRSQEENIVELKKEFALNIEAHNEKFQKKVQEMAVQYDKNKKDILNECEIKIIEEKRRFEDALILVRKNFKIE